MNEIVNKFLLAGDKFMPEIHLMQPRFTYSACGRFNKNKERIQKFKETGNSKYIYQNELIKLLIKYYVIKYLILLKIQNVTDINAGLLQWFISFLIKKTACGAVKN